MKIEKGFGHYRTPSGLSPRELSETRGSFAADDGDVTSYISLAVLGASASAEAEVIDELVQAEELAAEDASYQARRNEVTTLAVEEEATLPKHASTISRAGLDRLDKGWQLIGDMLNDLASALIHEGGLYDQLKTELARPTKREDERAVAQLKARQKKAYATGDKALGFKLGKELKKNVRLQDQKKVRQLRTEIERTEALAERLSSIVFFAAGGLPAYPTKSQRKVLMAYNPLAVVNRQIGELTRKKAKGVHGADAAIRELRKTEMNLVGWLIQRRNGVSELLQESAAYQAFCNKADAAEARNLREESMERRDRTKAAKASRDARKASRQRSGYRR